MAKFKLSIAESAVNDFEDILEWYKSQEVPHVGKKQVGQILNRIKGLRDFPKGGRVVPEFENENIREIIYINYRIVYRIAKTSVSVVRVWRSERLMREL